MSSWRKSSGRIGRHAELLREALATAIADPSAPINQSDEPSHDQQPDEEMLEYTAIRALEALDGGGADDLFVAIGDDVAALLLECGADASTNDVKRVCEYLARLLELESTSGNGKSAAAEGVDCGDDVDEEEQEDEEEDEAGEGLCRMCEREMPLTRHHVIPRTTHKKMLRKNLYSKEECAVVVLVCRPCHSALHRFEDEETLALSYNSLEKILAHPKVVPWIKYIAKQRVTSRSDALNRKLHYRR